MKDKIIQICCVLLYLGFSNVVIATEQREYFGTFMSDPVVTILSNSSDRPTFRLEEDFQFSDPNGNTWTAPAGSEVDGASIPPIGWSIVGGPMSGSYLYASIIHDVYCNTRILTAHDTHRNFYYGMKAKQVPSIKANLMYWAVRTFGPSWKVTRVVVPFQGTKRDNTPVNSPSFPLDPMDWNEIKKKIEHISIDTDPSRVLEELDIFSDIYRSDNDSPPLQRTISRR